MSKISSFHCVFSSFVTFIVCVSLTLSHFPSLHSFIHPFISHSQPVSPFFNLHFTFILIHSICSSIHPQSTSLPFSLSISYLFIHPFIHLILSQSLPFFNLHFTPIRVHSIHPFILSLLLHFSPSISLSFIHSSIHPKPIYPFSPSISLSYTP